MSKEKNLPAIRFQGKDVYLDQKLAFSVPGANTTKTHINVIGAIFDPSSYGIKDMYIGTGSCCHGHLLHTRMENGELELSQILTPDFNVYDILPLVTSDCKKAGLGNNNEGLLAVGYGCSGAGAKIIGEYCCKMTEIVGEGELRSLMGDNPCDPTFVIDLGKDSIRLDLFKIGLRAKPGRTREPGLPSILMNPANEEFYRTEEIVNSLDLKSRLESKGVDFKNTFRRLEDYSRFYQ